MIRNIQNRLKVLMSACVLSTIATTGWSQTLDWLGTAGDSESRAYAVSADGGVVVGRTLGTGFTWGMRLYSFRWIRSSGGHRLIRNDLESEAHGVSAEGNIIVGWSRNDRHRPRAYRWTAGVGLQDLGTLGGEESRAMAVSADGRVVVGWAQNGQFLVRAFRWENGIMQDLGTLGGEESRAMAVSADGRVVVGWAEDGQFRVRAFRWENGVMQNLGTLHGRSEALGVSADGSVVVGFYINAAGYQRAFRWTAAEGMQDLGALPGTIQSIAYGVSAYGNVVVGSSGDRAVRWTAAGRIEDLNISYANLLFNGSRLERASAVSPDGRYIVGYGTYYTYQGGRSYTNAYQLDTGCVAHNGDVDYNRCVDDADLLAVIFAFGNRGIHIGRVDVNCDGAVDDADLLTVLFNFGSGC
jgi:probable HAF family extracellular repeat protein